MLQETQSAQFLVADFRDGCRRFSARHRRILLDHPLVLLQPFRSGKNLTRRHRSQQVADHLRPFRHEQSRLPTEFLLFECPNPFYRCFAQHFFLLFSANLGNFSELQPFRRRKNDKNNIFDFFLWKAREILYFCTVFRKSHDIICSISLLNWNLERENRAF